MPDLKPSRNPVDQAPDVERAKPDVGPEPRLGRVVPIHLADDPGIAPDGDAYGRFLHSMQGGGLLDTPPQIGSQSRLTSSDGSSVPSTDRASGLAGMLPPIEASGLPSGPGSVRVDGLSVPATSSDSGTQAIDDSKDVGRGAVEPHAFNRVDVSATGPESSGIRHEAVAVRSTSPGPLASIDDPSSTALVLSDGPKWVGVVDLPAYGRRGVNEAARFVFDRFPCFAALRRQAGDDAVGAIKVIASAQGRMVGGTGVREASEWIRQNGYPVAGGRLSLPTIMEGYEPRIVIAMAEHDTFVLVHDEKTRGAPVDAVYCYSWKGGVDFYRNVRSAIPVIEGLVTPQDQVEASPSVRQIAKPVRQMPAKPPALVRGGARTDDLSIQRSSRGTLNLDARREGFALSRLDGIQRLQMTVAAHLVTLTAPDGGALASARTMDLTVSDPSGRVVSTTTVSVIDEIRSVVLALSPTPTRGAAPAPR